MGPNRGSHPGPALPAPGAFLPGREPGWFRSNGRISNSRRTFCVRFHGLALHCRRQVSWESGFAPRCAELRGFTAEISQTVEQTVKRESSRARVELFKRPNRAKREGKSPV